ncbi:glyoxylate reductase/hydroxypyruvate reductase isoform X1 [Nomia melanderi]|uniref:glyoxylate reductase/hydroxypyruvate reductase isoform X1 n=2 Tax=Nomia melanderi TaxID=2448451 RepID=UPI0013042F2E|nr:glyoxylate reductase/hydroxypyruvate reductase isoform X1 [Nomia melanderi]
MLLPNFIRFVKPTQKPLFSFTFLLSLRNNPKLFITSSIKMNRPKVLITRPDIPVAGLNLLQEQCDIILWEKPEPIPRSVLLSKVQNVDGVYCLLTDKIDDEVLNAAGPLLKVVGTMSVGVDHLDLKALKDRNIKVGYTPGILTDATAELTIGLLLATSRRLVEANRAIYKGEWKAWSPTWMCGPGLSGSTVGIVGLGRIGIQVAKILKGFNIAKILYTSRTVKQEASEFGGEKVKLDELLQESDFVIATTALAPETRQMFNEDTFKKMKRSGIFINVSRGEVVDQVALIEALKKGTIRAAGLDVMTPEPIPLDSELLKLDNCVVLPHIGSAATETREEMSRITAKNILAVLKGTPNEMPSPLQI